MSGQSVSVLQAAQRGIQPHSLIPISPDTKHTRFLEDHRLIAKILGYMREGLTKTQMAERKDVLRDFSPFLLLD